MLLGTEIPCYSVAYASGKSLIYLCLCQRKITVAYASGKYCPFIPSGSGIPGSCSMSSDSKRRCVDICSICNLDAG